MKKKNLFFEKKKVYWFWDEWSCLRYMKAALPVVYTYDGKTWECRIIVCSMAIHFVGTSPRKAIEKAFLNWARNSKEPKPSAPPSQEA
jgi:hypothetical protein